MPQREPHAPASGGHTGPAQAGVISSLGEHDGLAYALSVRFAPHLPAAAPAVVRPAASSPMRLRRWRARAGGGK